MIRGVRAFHELLRGLPSLIPGAPLSLLSRRWEARFPAAEPYAKSQRLLRLYFTNKWDDDGPETSRRDVVDLQRFPLDVQEILRSVEDSLCREILPRSSREWNDCNLTDEPTVLLTGVSGGCDSMGLLHAMLDLSVPVEASTQNRRFRDGRVCELHVIHFDHQQRGIESDRDCQLVQDFCQSVQIPCHTVQWEEDLGAKFSQDKARQWRQATMTRLLQELTFSSKRRGLILTAHHANDSQETLLLKLIRGVHVQNLSGMAQIQQMDDSTVLARPLLHLTKDQIRHYLKSQNYTWREDASNQSNKYLRNRVRNELIPLLQEMVGGEMAFQRRLENLEEQCRNIRIDLSSRAEPFLIENVDQSNRFLLSATVNFETDMVARQALYDWANAATNKHQVSYDLWRNVLCQLRDYPENRQWTLPLGEGWQLTRMGDSLQVVFAITKSWEQANSLPQSALGTETEQSIHWCYQKEQPDKEPHQFAPTRLTLVVRPDPRLFQFDKRDNDKATFVKSTAGSTTRIWKFNPPWRQGHSPLKLGSFLRGQKVPLHLRSTTPIIYCRQQNVDCASDKAEPVLVAVLVNGEWIVDAAWTAAPYQNDGSLTQLILNLQD